MRHDCKYPNNRAELISFLGGVQYYSRYIPNLSSIVEPLNRLRSSSVKWTFGKAECIAFDKLKKELASERILSIYDPTKALKLDTDASKYGLGAALSQIDENGNERPIEFISRTLSKSERNYSQIEKEPLAIVWSIKRLHRYLFAKPFTLVTDHKPLQFILNPNKSIPEMGISRIVRWSIFLSSYVHTMKYRPTKKHSNADMCSRFPLDSNDDLEEKDCETSMCSYVEDYESLESVFSIHYLGNDTPLIDHQHIAKHTVKDSLLCKVKLLVKEGWKENDCKIDSIEPYFNRKDEISIDKECLLWRSRVIIPEKLRKDILKLLHSTHSGMVNMKSIARNYVWWPKIDKDIEATVRNCQPCQVNQKKPQVSIPHPWVKPNEPWVRIHIDYCDLFGHMWLIIVCSYSKWVEVIKMNSTTSKKTIEELRKIFSQFGLPLVIVSDNGSQFVSKEFDNCIRQNGMIQILIPAYHPASNGQAESLVRKFKASMKKMILSNPDIMFNVSNWLLGYRNTIHPSTGKEPSLAMFGRKTRTAMSLLNPLSNKQLTSKDIKAHQKAISKEVPSRTFVIGENVKYYDVLKKQYYFGKIVHIEGSKVFIIEGEKGRVRKHLDHVSKSVILSNIESVPSISESLPVCIESVPSNSESLPVCSESVPSNANQPPSESDQFVSTEDYRRYSTRNKKPPDRLHYDYLGG